MHQFTQNKPCYYCGAPPPSTREHAPPQMMFKSLNCETPIVVPACNEHNHDKQDQPIITAMLWTWALAIEQKTSGSHRLTPNIEKALTDLPPNIPQTKKFVWAEPFLAGPLNDQNTSWPWMSPDVEVMAWIRQLTAAIAWSARGTFDPLTKWSDATIYTRACMPTKDRAHKWTTDEYQEYHRNWTQHELTYYSKFIWHSGWNTQLGGYPPDIYGFKIAFVPHETQANGENIIFKHTFYNAFTFYVHIAASLEMRQSLWKEAPNLQTREAL